MPTECEALCEELEKKQRTRWSVCRLVVWWWWGGGDTDVPGIVLNSQEKWSIFAKVLATSPFCPCFSFWSEWRPESLWPWLLLLTLERWNGQTWISRTVPPSQLLGGTDGSLWLRHWPCVPALFHPISFMWEVQKMREGLCQALNLFGLLSLITWIVFSQRNQTFFFREKQNKTKSWTGTLKWSCNYLDGNCISLKQRCSCSVDKAETDGLGFPWNILMMRRKWLGPLWFRFCQIHASEGLWTFDLSSNWAPKCAEQVYPGRWSLVLVKCLMEQWLVLFQNIPVTAISLSPVPVSLCCHLSASLLLTPFRWATP